MDYDKMHLDALQVLEEGFVPDEFNTTPLAEFTSAIPDTEVYGLELEYQYALTENTTLLGFYAFTDSEIGKHSSVILGNPDAQYALYDHLDFETGDMTQSWYELPTDQTGNMLPSQARHKASTSLRQDVALSGGSNLSLLATWAYNGHWYPTIGNIDLYRIPAHSRFDASATWTSADEQLSAQFYINNITDEISLNEFIASEATGASIPGISNEPKRVRFSSPMDASILSIWESINGYGRKARYKARFFLLLGMIYFLFG